MKPFAVNKVNPFLLAVIAIYGVLGVSSLNYVYFGDVIQQVSREAYWFYKTNFSSLLIPSDNEYGVWATGYHPPLMGIMTAALWKMFGHELWVSHAFSMFWAAMLVYHTWKLVNRLFPAKHAGWVTAITLLEPALLTQLVIASPDLILLTAFVIALRGIVERKFMLTAVGLFFLCGINMRGVIAGGMLFIANFFFALWRDKETWWATFKHTILAYLPALIILASYYVYFFIQKGWFLSDSPYSGHYALPQTFGKIIHHLAAFVFMSIESGRLIVWILALYAVYMINKRKEEMTDVEKLLGLFVILMNGVYFMFVFTTSMPFVPRYFLPQFFCLTLFVASFMVKHFTVRKVKQWVVVILLFLFSGHFWLYPDKMVKFWDTTLAHIPFYELREECFNFIESQNIAYENISAGFCLDENQDLIDLRGGKRFIATSLERDYFIYSNISNVPDRDYDTLHNPALWTPLRTFERWPVVITVYQRVYHGDGE